MLIAELATWISAGLAIVAVGLAAWQLWLARRAAREALERAEAMRRLAAAVENNAAKAAGSAQAARAQAERAWEQVKLSDRQLEEAKQERRTATQTEQWEWAYAVTTVARELVDTGQELIRSALDTQVAPHHRVAAERYYRQTTRRWQETMIKAVARTSPPLEVQQQFVTFSDVHQRLHGHLGVLLRAVETSTLAEGDALTKQILGLRHELNNAHRNLQRTVSASLTAPDSPTQQIAATPGS